MARRFLCCLGFSAMIACAAVSLAQSAAPDASKLDAPSYDPRHVDATQYGERVTLGPNWLFAPGDNPAYASPTFDDSSWKTVSSKKDLLDYGIRDIRYGWYRLHFHLRPGARNLTVALTGTNGGYEVYINGARIGSNGDMAGSVRFTQYSLVAYPVPDHLLAPQGDQVLAIRFAFNVGGNRGRGTSTPIGSRAGIYLLSGDAAPRDASYVVAHNSGAVSLVLAGLSLLAGMIALALFAAMRSQREYLAVAVYLIASSAYSGNIVWENASAFTFASSTLAFLCVGIANFALIEFVRLVLGLPRSRWLLTLQVASFVSAAASSPFSTGLANYYFGFASYYLPVLIVDILLPVLLVRAWLRGNREAYVLLPAVLIYSVGQYWDFLRQLAFFIHLTPALGSQPTFPMGSYHIALGSLSHFVFYVTMLLFLVLRTVAIARERAHVAAELEAARAVQQVLIPDEIPSIPGFTIESVYKPAGEVGGDFFQILPVKSGGVLVAIGDVSGKGMPAAMTVSLLVGTLRTLAHYTQSPSEILAAMNQRMIVRSHGGFTTCLVLRCDADGKLTVANAGHIAPYIAGKELPLENGLPLGVAAGSTYAECSFQLAPATHPAHRRRRRSPR
jgi:phosphoserine phosphatase RsbU/P